MQTLLRIEGIDHRIDIALKHDILHPKNTQSRKEKLTTYYDQRDGDRCQFSHNDLGGLETAYN